jgi:hypothetical protein
MRMWRAALVVACSALLASSAAGASATATWLAPVALSAEPVHAPDVAVNEAGDSVVAWQAADRRIVARFRAADAGAWGAPTVLGLGSEGGTRPGVAIDDQGAAIVAWRSSGPAVESRVLAAYRSAWTGRWGPAARLSSEGVTHEPVVRLDEEGDAIAMWVRPDAARTNHLETAYRPDRGSWEQPVEVASSNWLFGVDLAVGYGDGALLSWIEDAGDVVRSALGERGRWQTPVELARDVASLDTAAALGPGGRAAVAWTRSEHGNSLVQAAVRPAYESSWRSATLSFEDGQAEAPELAIDGFGNITAVWATNVDYEASYLPSSAETWQRPVAISPPKGSAGTLTLAVNDHGDAVAIWNTFVYGGDIVAARRPAGSVVWEAPTTIPAAGWRLRNGLGLDGAGNAIVVWTHLRNGVADVARAAALDAAPPVLEFERRAGGPVGVPLDFRARAFDVWSGLAGPVRWSFGDGASAEGHSVRHAYRATGDYTVTIEATDALGQMSRDSGLVSIEPVQALRNAKRPSIVGLPRVRRRIVCNLGRWSGSHPIRYSPRWLRNGRPVPGATKRTYLVRRHDAGTLVACRVRATNPAGSIVATSRAVRIAA